MQNNSKEVLYSEDNYLTKEEVSEKLNYCNVDLTWEKIVNYRSYFTEYVDLPNFDRTKFTLTYNKTLLIKAANLERQFNDCYRKYNLLSLNVKNELKQSCFSKTLSNFALKMDINVDSNLINNLVSKNASNIPNDYIVVNNYLSCLEYIYDNKLSLINTEDFKKIYTILTFGKTYTNLLDFKKIENDIISINEMMDLFTNYINNKNEFVFIKALVSYFYFNFVNPFEIQFVNHDILIFEYILSLSLYNEIACLLNFENFIKDINFEEKFNLSKNTKDLTYFLRYYLDKLSILISNFNSKLDALLENDVVSNENNEIGAVNDYQNEVSTSDNILMEQTSSIMDDSSIYSKAQVALPNIPRNLSKEDIDQITMDLLETYPQLRKSQAHFYASHCTIGKTYTIRQFKTYEKTSYETARTSMDFLVQLGFYTKSQLKNKFVYRPVIRNNNFEND